MIVYRLGKQAYANDLSGRGAELTGGRWNSRGMPVVYASSSRALCLSELAVHLPLGCTPGDYFITTMEIPRAVKVRKLNFKLLPDDWRTFPHPASTKAIGDRFLLENKHSVLKVPSAIVPEECNYLINPRHAHAAKIRIVACDPFRLDGRLFGR